MNDAWSVRLTRRADKDLRRLDPPVRQRVVTALESLAKGEQTVQARRLKGADEFRLRVGDWRVRFRRDLNQHQIVVLRVLPRGRAYR